MKTYDEAAPCPKCAGTDLCVQYWPPCTYERSVERNGKCQDPRPFSEHLSVHCRRCSYEWDVAPARKKKKIVAAD